MHVVACPIIYTIQLLLAGNQNLHQITFFMHFGRMFIIMIIILCCNALSVTASMSLRSGYPVISISLPSRKEICDFTLRPHLQTVGELSKQIMAEDRGVDRSVPLLHYIHFLLCFGLIMLAWLHGAPNACMFSQYPSGYS